MPPPRRYCDVDGCDRPRFGQGFCQAHYKRYRKYGDPGPAEVRRSSGRDACSVGDCDRITVARGLCSGHYRRWLDTGEIPTTPLRQLSKHIKYEKCLRPYCGLRGPHQGMCQRHYKRWRLLQDKYGIGWEEFDTLWEQSSGECGICRCTLDVDERSTHIDHCHTTGRVRGILCHACNLMLGHAKDSPEVLQAAILYLQRWKMVQ
jgi:hypothetical protein